MSFHSCCTDAGASLAGQGMCCVHQNIFTFFLGAYKIPAEVTHVTVSPGAEKSPTRPVSLSPSVQLGAKVSNTAGPSNGEA